MPQRSAGIHYRVQVLDAKAHLFAIELHIRQPAARQMLLLPVWIPGSYLVREFAKNLQGLAAMQRGQSVALRQCSKNTWELDCTAAEPVTISYQFCAYDSSVRAAWLDARRGFFNGTSLFLRVAAQAGAAHTLELAHGDAITAGWRIATALPAVDVDAQGWGLYRAADYDELVDCPVEMGHFWRGEFAAAGVAHSLVVTGAAPGFDGQRLLRDAARICGAALAFWQASPFAPGTRYVFLLHAVDDGYGGLEHRSSSALLCARRDLPRLGDAQTTPGYITVLGLVSHEYFHAWCVKRLRPKNFVRIDYGQENYTDLLWFFEGFTSYYDDLLLRRAGIIDNAQYLRLLARNINQVRATPGRQLQSAAQASFDAWVKYYRVDANTPNQTVSYYSKGALIAACLDLLLRREGRTTLDAVMRALWQRCWPEKDGGMTQDDVLAVLQELGGRSFAEEMRQWVHGTQDLPWADLFAAHGVQIKSGEMQPAQHVGLRVREDGGGMTVSAVLRASAAERAGFMAGDEWLALEVPAADMAAAVTRWRMRRLDDLALYAGAATQVTAWVARDAHILALPLRLEPTAAPDSAANLVLEIGDAQAAGRWLDGSSSG